MTRVSCDSWNVILLGNMVFLVLVSVNVELGGREEGVICEFFCFIPGNNGGIGMGDKIIDVFAGDRFFVMCDRE